MPCRAVRPGNQRPVRHSRRTLSSSSSSRWLPDGAPGAPRGLHQPVSLRSGVEGRRLAGTRLRPGRTQGSPCLTRAWVRGQGSTWTWLWPRGWGRGSFFSSERSTSEKQPGGSRARGQEPRGGGCNSPSESCREASQESRGGTSETCPGAERGRTGAASWNHGSVQSHGRPVLRPPGALPPLVTRPCPQAVHNCSHGDGELLEDRHGGLQFLIRWGPLPPHAQSWTTKAPPNGWMGGQMKGGN